MSTENEDCAIDSPGHTKALSIFIKMLRNSLYKLERWWGETKGVSGHSVQMPNNQSKSSFHIAQVFQWHQAQSLCYSDLNEQEPVF